MLIAARSTARVLDLLGTADTLLVDQFGTLHDGTLAYPGAAAALRRLREAGVRVALLSNSGKRAAPNAARLERLGIDAGCYDLLMTSGELGWRQLAEGRLPRARRALLLTRGGDPLLDGTGIEPAADAARAQLVVIAGSEGDAKPLAAYGDILAPAARLGLPALCLNPDRLMLTPSGLAFGAGRIAELYESLGGSVTWVGKPHAAIYDSVLATLRVTDRSRVAGVGDSAEHDIAGAKAAQCQGWLVRTGLLEGLDDAALGAECERHAVTPDVVLDRFA